MDSALGHTLYPFPTFNASHVLYLILKRIVNLKKVLSTSPSCTWQRYVRVHQTIYNTSENEAFDQRGHTNKNSGSTHKDRTLLRPQYKSHALAVNQ